MRRHWFAHLFGHPMPQRGQCVGTCKINWDGPMPSNAFKEAVPASGNYFYSRGDIGELNKFEDNAIIRMAVCLKMDPYCQQAELRPNTAFCGVFNSKYQWQRIQRNVWSGNTLKWRIRSIVFTKSTLVRGKNTSDESFCSIVTWPINWCLRK